MFKKIVSKPKIVFRNFDDTGKLRSIIQYIDKNKEENLSKSTMLPFWCIGTFCYLCSAILIILGASLYLVLTGRSGLYGESCVNRSCLKVLNMKCINGTCSCLSNQYYMKGCNMKKNYLEQCLPYINTCLDNQNLTCLDGVCKCRNTSYWNGFKCVSNAGYSETCSSNNQCLLGPQMICDSSRTSCLCDTNRLFYIFIL